MILRALVIALSRGANENKNTIHGPLLLYLLMMGLLKYGQRLVTSVDLLLALSPGNTIALRLPCACESARCAIVVLLSPVGFYIQSNHFRSNSNNKPEKSTPSLSWWYSLNSRTLVRLGTGLLSTLSGPL